MKNIYHLAQRQFALSHLSNLLTRSDYVVYLEANREGPEFIMDWQGGEGTPWFTPFPE